MMFLQKVRSAFTRWMTGRHGMDYLGLFTLISGLALSLLGSIFRTGLLSFIGLALYITTLLRMFSRNQQARLNENQKYLELTGNVRTKSRQFFLRLKNRKEYKYFRCPGCRQLLRLKRGCGEKEITCAKCGHQFKKKA